MSLAHTLPHTEKRLNGNNGHESAGDLILLAQEGWFCLDFSSHLKNFKIWKLISLFSSKGFTGLLVVLLLKFFFAH